MVRFSPFCDSDLRYGLQLLAGINLMLAGVSIIVDLLVITEISHYYEHWENDTVTLPLLTADITLTVDMIVIALQLFYGFQLYDAVSKNTYSKIWNWKLPSVFIVLSRLSIIIFYVVMMPVSPFHLYFSSIAILYSVFLFWPVNEFLQEFAAIPWTENSRLIRRANNK